MYPSRPFEASMTSVTILSCLQVIPSQLQQSVSFRHEAARPPSRESPSRNWRREPFSCTVQELVGEAKQISNRRATPSEGNSTREDHFRKVLVMRAIIAVSVSVLDKPKWRARRKCSPLA